MCYKWRLYTCFPLLDNEQNAAGYGRSSGLHKTWLGGGGAGICKGIHTPLQWCSAQFKWTTASQHLDWCHTSGGQCPAARPLCSAHSMQVSLQDTWAICFLSSSLPSFFPFPPSFLCWSCFQQNALLFEDGYVILYSPEAIYIWHVSIIIFTPGFWCFLKEICVAYFLNVFLTS